MAVIQPPPATIMAPSTTVGWEVATPDVRRRCAMMQWWGDTGTGRTTAALSAPGPIALIHSAEKIEGIVERAVAGGKMIRTVSVGGAFQGTMQEMASQADALWNKFLAAYYDSYRWARSIVIDTDTDLWELLRFARFGGLKPSGGRVDANYGPVNAEMDSVFKYFKTQNRTNLILVGKSKDEYVRKAGKSDGMGERTGRTIIGGYKNIPYMCDVRVRTSRDLMNGGDFQCVIEKGWYNATVEGVPLTGDMMNFESVMGMVTEDYTSWAK